MKLRVIWQFMDRSVAPKILYGPQFHFGPYNILGVTDRSINCHLAQSAMNYLLYYTQPSKTTSIRTQLGALYGLSRFYILFDLVRSNILYIGPACLQRQIV